MNTQPNGTSYRMMEDTIRDKPWHWTIISTKIALLLGQRVILPAISIKTITEQLSRQSLLYKVSNYRKNNDP